MNVDAAIDNSKKKMGFGCILRNSDGEFLLAKGIPWFGNFSLKEAEAIGIREALNWLKMKRNDDNIQIEMDAL